MKEEDYIIYIDTGGTFSDAVIIRKDGSFITGKASTTPDDLSICFFNCIKDAAKKMGKSLKEVLSKTIILGYGTTAGTNVVITRLGPKLGLITTKGMEDTTIIMKCAGRFDGLNSEEMMHLCDTDMPETLIPRDLIEGVTERIDSKGTIFIPLREGEVKDAVRTLKSQGVDGIAVCLLWSFLNDIHERRIGEIIGEIYPDLPVSISVDVAPVVREYTRFNSTIINLYISGPVKKLFSVVKGKLKNLGYKRPLLVMQAAGGLSRSEIIQPINTLNSGPVGGLVGVEFFKNVYGITHAMGSDVGGTSFDISIASGEGTGYIREPLVSRFRIANPMCEIISIGAGGGTIAYMDKKTRLLHVGTESSGSKPGPVCYDLGGTEPTVTDADVVMNRIDPEFFLGGKMKLNREKAMAAIEEKIARPMGMEIEEAALAISNIIDSAMESTITTHLRERGLDPKEFVLFAFGGAGPTHCAGYSKGSGIEKVIIPPYAATFSAFGASTANIMHRYVTSPQIVIPNINYDLKTLKFNISSLKELSENIIDRFNKAYQELEKRGHADMKEEGFKREEIIANYELEARYGGQLWEVIFSSPVKRIESIHDFNIITDSFEKEYQRLYGKGAMYPNGGFEIITMALRLSVAPVKPGIIQKGYKGEDPLSAIKGERKVFFDNRFLNTPIYSMEKLEHGYTIKGPAIIEGTETTLVVPPDRKITVDGYLNMVMEFCNVS
ncbi:MAG: hydantoinase/oxoprolinase family protein [Thermodesulfobacteriota bacterium]|nr:hydantoinase/oxoprolinase family protein [Thermodesulfobacteriota bacterium]